MKLEIGIQEFCLISDFAKKTAEVVPSDANKIFVSDGIIEVSQVFKKELPLPEAISCVVAFFFLRKEEMAAKKSNE